MTQEPPNQVEPVDIQCRTIFRQNNTFTLNYFSFFNKTCLSSLINEYMPKIAL